MEHFRNRNKIKSSNGDEFKSRRTKASVFVNFLIKVCFIPVTVTEEKIIFKIFHWKTMVNVLFVVGFYFLVYLVYHLLDIPYGLNQANTSVEKITTIIVDILANFVRIFPLILSYGLQNLRSRQFNNRLHQSPNKKLILTFVLFAFGLFFVVVDIDKILSLSAYQVLGLLSLYVAICCMEFLVIFSLPLLIEILTKDFEYECQRVSRKENFKDIIEWYKELNKSLQFYCLCFFSYFQFMFIFNIYKSFSSLSIVLEPINISKLIGKISMTIRQWFN